MAGAHRKATPARRFAFSVLREARTRDGFAREILNSRIEIAQLSAEDRAFARTLVLGVTATRGTLDELIDSVLSSPNDIEDDVRDALRIGVYELFFLEKSPHAAVDQCVSLVNEIRPRATGVANFALRHLVKRLPDFPFGDVYEDPMALSRATGFPRWITDMAIARFGKAAGGRYLFSSNDPAPVFFTVNACKATDEEVFAELEAAGIAHISGGLDDEAFGNLPVSFCRRLEQASDVSSPVFTSLIRQGKVIVSDASAQAIAIMALPEEFPKSMLEIGAGRGTKTLLLQSAAMRRFGRQLPLTSVDYLDFKTDLLKERLRDAGITAGEVLVADGTDLDATFPGRSFDAIFIDAPCSGLGTLRRHPEIRWRITPEDISSLAVVGAKMLSSAASHLSPGGLLTYSTCTFTPEETTELIASFLESPESAGLKLIPYAQDDADFFASRLTHARGDAHFAARMRRSC